MGNDHDSNVSIQQPDASELAEKLAHDLSNQVMVIQGNAMLLRLKTTESPELQDLVDQILAACQNAVTLTRDLSLTVSDMDQVNQ